jgi:hypothetical protein
MSKLLKISVIFALILLWVGGSQQTEAQNSNSAVTHRIPTTIAVANTFQTAIAANPNRLSIQIENNNTNTDNCFVDYGIGVTAANASETNAIILVPGGSFTRYFPSFVPSDEIEVTCAGTDHLRVDWQ